MKINSIKDRKVIYQGFYDIEREVKNYDKIKTLILSEYKKSKKEPTKIDKYMKLKWLQLEKEKRSSK